MMTLRQFWVLLVLAGSLLTPRLAAAQEAAEETPVYTGNLGGGFAITGGNTDTSNFNFTAALVRDPKTNNVIKASAAYLRGNQNDVLNLDRTSFVIRDEYSISGRTFVFGQLDYLRDNFKEIIFLWVPAGGVGFRLADSDSTSITLDGGAGAIVERNPGREASKSGSLILGQRFQQRVSSTATFIQSLSSTWKTEDFADSLTNFSAGLTTTLVGNLELKLELINSYKNKPANPALKKNDTAFVTAFVVKF